MKTWEELSLVEQLQSTWSDFHKEVHGFRPRFASDEQWNSAEWLQAQIDDLAAYCQTPFYKEQQAAEEAFYAQQELEMRIENEEDAVLRELRAPLTLGEQVEQEMRV